MKRLLLLALLANACAHKDPDEEGALGPPPPGEAAKLRPLNPDRLVYPEDALPRVAQGDVRAKICLDEEGKAQKCAILKDEPKLGAYVERAVSGWRFGRLPADAEGARCFERTFRFRISPSPAELEACEGGALVTPEYELPRKIRSVSPKYPQALRDKNVEGDVVLLVRLDEDGDVYDTQLLDATARELAGPAIDAVKKWQWNPATLRGKPVRACLPVRLEFRLRQKEQQP